VLASRRPLEVHLLGHRAHAQGREGVTQRLGEGIADHGEGSFGRDGATSLAAEV